MSTTNFVPSYRRHKQSGQAIVTVPDGRGGRKDVLLGRYGTHQSRVEYARVVAEWETNGRTLPAKLSGRDMSVNELFIAFMKHAAEHYRRPDGAPGKEYSEFKFTLRPACHFYGNTLARDFGPLALKTIRQKMIEGYDHPEYGPQEQLSRGVINQRVGRIRRVFRWGVENELVPPGVLQGLEAVRGLQRGRSKARETDPVRPVSQAFVQATLPHMLPMVAAMVQLQLHTGMRPGELVIMRGIDIDMTGTVWLYRPGSDHGQHGDHKTAWRGHNRVVPIGPRAQQILRSCLKLDTHAYLFSPSQAVEMSRLEKRKTRKTKVQPSQANRKKSNPQVLPGERYTVMSYGRAITRACEKAFPPPAPLARQEGETRVRWKARLSKEQKEELSAWRRQHRWHPHQLRHTKATEIRREAGLDAARVVLGHRSPQITETYAEIDVNKAAEVMAKLG